TDVAKVIAAGEVNRADIQRVGVQPQRWEVGEEVIRRGQGDGLPRPGRVIGVRAADQDAVVGRLARGNLDGEPAAANRVVEDARVRQVVDRARGQPRVLPERGARQ